MSVRPLTDAVRQPNDCEVIASQLKGNSDTLGMADACNTETIEQLLDSARTWAHTTAWVVYRAGEQMHLVGQGDPRAQWPASVANEEFDTFCQNWRLHRWPTGSGESVLGWLLAPVDAAAEPALAGFARRLGIQVQTNTLARAQITQRVLYEITYLASSTRDRSVFLVGVHQLLASLIDAENFYLALYDPHSGKIDYP